MNSKTHRYGVCNAMETLLLHNAIAKQVLPALCDAYLDKGVELRGCRLTRAIVPMMTATIEALKAAEIRGKVKVVIGGAPVSAELAEKIGADGYSPDGATAVDTIAALISS